MARAAFKVSHLSKTYPRQSQPATDDLTFEIFEGEIFGLLGDNGAGKTTLVRQMINLVRPDRARSSCSGGTWRRIPATRAVRSAPAFRPGVKRTVPRAGRRVQWRER